MLETEIKVNRLMRKYLRMLTEDLADARMAEQPVAGVNHPAWILGHLAFAADRACTLLGQPKAMSDTQTAQYGPGSKLTANRGDYPAKADLLRLVEEQYERLFRTIAEATADKFAAPSQNPFSKDVLPTVGDGVAHLLTSHMGVHLGQLSAWRRMIGLPALF